MDWAGVDPTFPEGDIRRDWSQERWFQESLEKVERLRPLEGGRTLGQLALRAHPSDRFRGDPRRQDIQVEANVAASAHPLLSEEHLGMIREVSHL